MKNDDELDEEIKEYEEKIKELKKEKKRKSNLPDDQRLAEALHEKQCHWAHEDQCGWFYESWEKPGYSRNEYLEKAQKMLSEMSFEQAMKVVKYL